MDRGASDPAEILEDAIEHQDHVRRTLSIEVDDPTLGQLERTIEDARDRLTALSGMPLGVREGAGFLRYLPGGFYRPHRDKGDLPSWPGASFALNPSSRAIVPSWWWMSVHSPIRTNER